jgi:hypothetical protein
MEGLSVDVKIILKLIKKTQISGRVLDLPGPEYRKMAGSYDGNNEASGFRKCEKIF